MAESLQTGAQQKSADFALNSTSQQQETNSCENGESIFAISCGEGNQLQLKDSGSLSVTGEVVNSETKTIDSMPSRDIDAENRLITALRLSCKLSPGHLVQSLDVLSKVCCQFT